MKNALVIIDPQNDFCSPNGTLFVPGAEGDCVRIAQFIDKNQSKIDSIHISLDAHPTFHIAHPIFWINKDGKMPEPFTVITYQSFVSGEWQPVKKELKARVEEYLLELEARGHYNLTIWPPHCLQASYGFLVDKNVFDAVNRWEHALKGRNVSFVVKASNPFTEHYSAVQAEVPDKNDPTTRVNYAFIDSIKQFDNVYIAGEAFSHCVSNTIRDLAPYITYEKMVLLSDCSSSVTGFEEMSKSILADFTRQGMRCALSTLPL